MKIHPVGAEVFHADERINMTKLTVAFRNNANAPKKLCHLLLDLPRFVSPLGLHTRAKSGNLKIMHPSHFQCGTCGMIIHTKLSVSIRQKGIQM